MRRPITLGAALAAFVLVALVVPVSQAYATYPGANGRIAFVSGGTIQTVNSNGTGLFTVAPWGAGFTYEDPTWSPNADRLAFSRHAAGEQNWDVLIVDTDGTNQVRLADLYQEDAVQPSWTPDGEQVAYRCSGQAVGSGGGDICRVDDDGRGLVNLTGTNNADEFDPAYSPDGTRLAVSQRFQHTHHGNREIYVIGPGGGRLTNTSVNNEHPSWSPDGSKIAFDRSGDIWVMDVDGSDQTPLTGAAAFEDHPSWSPDGSKITYQRENNLWVMNADGSDQTAVPGLTGGASPDWGPVPSADSDGDGVGDAQDNCPNQANANQGNADGDAQGDACDTDDDNDSIVDGQDNCPAQANGNQANNDGDSQGDVCDSDDDNDSVVDLQDNCPSQANAGQANADEDAQGDACDGDDDNDSVADIEDDCPVHAGAGSDGCPPSSFTLRVRRLETKLQVKGAVLPSHPGHSLTVTLLHRVNGAYEQLAQKTLVLSSASTYSTRFRRPSSRRCQMIGDFPGDADHGSSTATVTFGC